MRLSKRKRMKMEFPYSYIHDELLPYYESISLMEKIEIYNQRIVKPFDNNGIFEFINLAVVKYTIYKTGIDCSLVWDSYELDLFKKGIDFFIKHVYESGYLVPNFHETIRLVGDKLVLIGGCSSIDSLPPQASSDRNPFKDFLIKMNKELSNHNVLSNHHFKVSELTDGAHLFNRHKFFDVVTSEELVNNSNDSRIPVFFCFTEEKEYSISSFSDSTERLVAVIVTDENFGFKLLVFLSNGTKLSNKLFTIK